VSAPQIDGTIYFVVVVDCELDDEPPGEVTVLVSVFFSVLEEGGLMTLVVFFSTLGLSPGFTTVVCSAGGEVCTSHAARMKAEARVSTMRFIGTGCWV